MAKLIVKTKPNRLFRRLIKSRKNGYLIALATFLHYKFDIFTHIKMYIQGLL